MKKAILVDIITLFFVLLFVYTGVAKLAEIHLFKEQLLSSPFLGSPFLANLFTWSLPIFELLLAIAFFIPKLRLKALYVTLVVMSLFTIYVIIIFFMDNHLSCSCGGIVEELTPKQHIIFNSSCVLLSALAILICKRAEPTIRFRWFTGTSVTGLFVLVGWILVTAFATPVTAKTGMEGRLLPSFELLLPDSTTHLNTTEIPVGKPLIVIGFSPWCIHCQAETRDIIRHMDQFKDTKIYYVTSYPFDQMKTFYKAFKLSKYPNIVMGRDLKNVFLPYFKANGVPYTGVFDSKKRLKQVFAGEAKAEKLAQATVEN